MATNMTKKEMFRIIAQADFTNLAVSEDEILDFIKHEIELLDHKNSTKSANRKPSARQIENEKIKDEILAYLLDTGNTCRVSDLIANVPCLDGLGSQKVTSLMTQLSGGTKSNGTEPVERIVEKKIAYYRARV